MNRVTQIRITNLILFVSGAVEAATGLAMFFKLFASKPGVFGLMLKIHEYNGLFFIFLVAMHIFQNRGWVMANFFRKTQG